MKKQTLVLAIFLSTSFLSMHCATIMKGYESSVQLKNAPENIRVIDHDGLEIPVVNKIIRVGEPEKEGVYIEREVKVISLRNNKEYILHLKSMDKEKVVRLYPKIGFGWACLDFLCGVVPSLYDAYTGSWNRYADVDASF